MTRQNINRAIELANKVYGDIEELNNILEALMDDNNLDLDTQIFAAHAYADFPDVTYLDEIIAKLGTIKFFIDKK